MRITPARARLLRLTVVFVVAAAMVSGQRPSAQDPQAGPPATRSAFENPIIVGDWSDPGLIRVGDDYYSVRSTFGWQPGLPIVHSKDLRHWE